MSIAEDTVSKKEWGEKHICGNCEARFYDMQKIPATCPKCGTVDEAVKPTAKKRAAVKDKPTETKAAPELPAEETVDDEDETEDDDILLPDDDGDDDDEFDDEEDNGLMEDASDLVDEDEDLSEAKEHMEESGKD